MANQRTRTLPEWLPPLSGVGTVEHYKRTDKGHLFRLSLIGDGTIEVMVPHDFEGAGKVVISLARIAQIIDENRPEPKQAQLFKKGGAR